MPETPPNSENIEKRFFVKLFHLDNGCVNSGKSDRFEVVATDLTLRRKIETEDHPIFHGDKCKNCTTLAKVWYEEIPTPEDPAQDESQ